MKKTVMVPKEIDFGFVLIEIPPRLMPNDFPMPGDSMTKILINIEEGIIQNWPEDSKYLLDIKVGDNCDYTLIDNIGTEVKEIQQSCVPNELIPGEHGDFILLKINEHGRIENWPESPEVTDFFPEALD